MEEPIGRAHTCVGVAFRAGPYLSNNTTVEPIPTFDEVEEMQFKCSKLHAVWDRRPTTERPNETQGDEYGVKGLEWTDDFQLETVQNMTKITLFVRVEGEFIHTCLAGLRRTFLAAVASQLPIATRKCGSVSG